MWAHAGVATPRCTSASAGDGTSVARALTFVLNFCTVFSASSRFMGAEGGGASGRGGPGAMDIGIGADM